MISLIWLVSRGKTTSSGSFEQLLARLNSQAFPSTTPLSAEQIGQLAEYGADTGWPGLTYTSECVQVFDRFAEEIKSHQLRREIIVNRITNTMINEVGPTMAVRPKSRISAPMPAMRRTFPSHFG